MVIRDQYGLGNKIRYRSVVIARLIKTLFSEKTENKLRIKKNLWKTRPCFKLTLRNQLIFLNLGVSPQLISHLYINALTVTKTI